MDITILFLFLKCFQSKLDSDKEFGLQPHLADIDRLFAGDSMEEIFTSLEKDGSPWATKQLETLKKMVSDEIFLINLTSPSQPKKFFMQYTVHTTQVEATYRPSKHILE